MLTQDTKRKIDSARDILVGKVPDPKAQVEQITTALIYKFMDDMDKGSQELGGKSRFFTNGYEKYSWTKLMDPKLGGHERLDLYVEALTRLSLNPHIPQLFRDIFKDAFLPYRNPETLSLFLKEINGFTYEHSEDLGDSFEYLLSVLGSQGDAGQFRTPRHIIDFIVDVVDPKKDDTVCDPACGTAGFLISAYKHILKQHDGKDDPENKEKPLTPDERKKLMDHFTGYDISPDMVRLSRVNLYLHGFPSPTIDEYDTLSSEEKWDESFDVMLANPPFMTTKGGIKPHKRFSVQANRSEVLFVDYILEHLRPNGRAGIIVPEGIIFQSGNAYKQLRKMLVEDGLLSVVSLPSGVFNPYAGVKTCILLFDKVLAKKTQHILFIKISNDGFDLGAQRRRIEKNDLPTALVIIKEYKKAVEADQDYTMIPQMSFLLDDEQKEANRIATIVTKEKIAESGDYNLSGDRYKEVDQFTNQKWPMEDLGKLTKLFTDGNWIESKDQSENGIRLIQTGNIGLGEYLDKSGKTRFISEETFKRLNCTEVFADDILVSRLPDPVGRTCMVPKLDTRMITAVDCTIIRFDEEKIIPKYFLYFSKSDRYFNELSRYLTGSSRQRISRSNLAKIKIPLPPLEVQKEILEQIEVKQQAIEHAKAIIKNLEREREYFGQSLRKLENIEWVELGKLSIIVRGSSPRPQGDKRYYGGNILRLMVADVTRDGMYTTPKIDFLTNEGAKLSRPMKKGDLIMAVSGQPGLCTILNVDACIHDGFVGFRNLDKTKVLTEFAYYILMTMRQDNNSFSIGAVFKNLNTDQVKKIKIPIPPLEKQKQLVAEAEREEEIVAANRRLIELMEQKIQQVLGEI